MTRPNLSDGYHVIDDHLTEVLISARRVMKPLRVDQLGQAERMRLMAGIAVGVRGEVAAAYGEQINRVLMHYGRSPNYRLSSEDLTFAARWARWMVYRAELAEWHLRPEHRAAAAAEQACPERDRVRMPQEIRDVLATRPAEVREVTLADAPEGWPPQIVAWSWAATFESLIVERKRMAGVARLDREPGDDDDREPAPSEMPEPLPFPEEPPC